MGRDVKGKNQGMDGTGSADPGTRMAAEEKRQQKSGRRMNGLWKI